MPEDEGSNLPAALIQIRDVLGFSEPTKRLLSAISHGVGRLTYPWERRRNAEADADAFRIVTKAIQEAGTSVIGVEASLEERTKFRVTAQEVRRQQHREQIAVQAIAEVCERPGEFAASEIPVDFEWLDRFWRLAEDIATPDFQSLWARILARHATGGVRISARCLQTLSTLSREEAAILERLASITVTTRLRDGHEGSYILSA